MSHVMKIPRTSDRALIDGLAKIAEKFTLADQTFSVLGAASVRNVDPAKPVADLQHVLSLDAYLISEATSVSSGFILRYYRGGKNENDAIFDEIYLEPMQGAATPLKDRVELAAMVSSVFREFKPNRFPGEALTPEQASLLAIQESTVQRLERLTEDLISRNSDFRLKLENDHRQKEAELREALEAETQKVAERYNALETAVRERETQLADRAKALDDRNNTHVRRDIRDRMLSDVQARIKVFGVSDRTQEKRTPVLMGIVVLGLIACILLAWTAVQINDVVSHSKADRDDVVFYLTWIRFGLFSFLLVGTILYYIKWQNLWAQEHATSESNLQQFYIDVNRANWALESCLEWRKETKSAIPKELIQSITNNLFSAEHVEAERVIHPADELASALMGSASKVKLRVGGNELEFGRPDKIPKKAVRRS